MTQLSDREVQDVRCYDECAALTHGKYDRCAHDVTAFLKRYDMKETERKGPGEKEKCIISKTSHTYGNRILLFNTRMLAGTT